MKANMLLLSFLLLLTACGSGGEAGPGQSSSTVAVSAGIEKLAEKLGEKEIWSPAQILLEARLLLGDGAAKGLAAMDTYYHLNCSKVMCAVIKKGL